MDFYRIFNVALRFFTLFTRFIFIFFLAKYLDPASVGYYGLFTATVSYALYLVGVDFYTYATREILRTTNDRRGQLLKAQATLSSCLYIALLPIALLLLIKLNWPKHLIWWFFPILVLEHFNQEMSRLLIALSEQIAASIVLFLRQGSWALVIVLLMIFNNESRSLNMVFTIWFCGGLAAAILGAWKLRHLDMGGWSMPVDWHWIRRGITVSLGFLISTLALRATQTIDRYWLEALGGLEMVGAYALFMGIAGTLLVFLDAGVFAYAYPELIRYNHRGQHDRARNLIRKALAQTLAFSLIFGAVSWTLLPFLLTWIGNPAYLAALSLYPWLLSAMILNALSMIPHYALYARNFDRPIIFSHIAALAVFIPATWLFSRTHSTLAVPIGLNFSFLLILIWKTSAYLNLGVIEKSIGGTRPSP